MTTLLAFLGGYCLISYVLARRPTLLHPKRKRAFQARHISHRGGAAEGLENTLSAFKHAKAVGTDMFELDCHLTRDGEVVVAHDNNLERLTGIPGSISEFNYHELPPLKKQMEVQFDPGVSCPASEDTTIPRLTDLFAAFPTMPMNIDVKIDDDELIHKVSDLVRQFDRAPITVWGSRFDAVAEKLHAINPEVPLFFSTRATLRLLVLYWFGLLPFVSVRHSYLELPMPSTFLDPKFAQWGSGSWKARAIIFMMELLSMRPGLIRHLEKRGITTYLWVLNSEAEFEKAFSLGCEGVMTDCPTRLRHYLDQNFNADMPKQK